MRTQRYLVVSHDAGGAEVLSAWVRRHPETICDFVLEGPADSIFRRKLGEIDVLSRSAFEDLKAYDLVLTGTSWASDLEKTAIIKAKESGKTVASYIDHWVNYKKRFVLNEVTTLPDEIWLGDEEALRIAAKSFPEGNLKLVPNPYFEDIKEEFMKIRPPAKSRADELHILYVAEPVEDLAIKVFGDARHYGYTEFEALDGFLVSLGRSDFRMRAILRLRLHPSEKKGKYSQVLLRFSDIQVEISEGNSLVQDCAWADWVVGCESMAMVIGILGNKKVFTAIPYCGHPCRLPFEQVKNFNLELQTLERQEMQ